MAWLRFRIQHPYCPGSKATLAVEADGECAALAGSIEELRAAAGRGARPSKAVFILLRDTGAWPEMRERDELWHLLGVPAYAIWVDGGGRQLGWECEAQEGLHVAEGLSVNPAGFWLETEPCGCGRPGARLVRVEVEAPAMAMAGD